MDEKICKNCKHYVLYYCNVTGTFRQISIGHCLLDNRKKRIYCYSTCDKWESSEEAKNKRHENIEKTLRDMAKDLSQIAQILKEEKRL